MPVTFILTTTVIQRATLQRAIEIDANFTIHSDGSASGGTTYVGVGVVVTAGNPANPTVVATLHDKGENSPAPTMKSNTLWS